MKQGILQVVARNAEAQGIFSEEKKVLIAVSGGPDSLFLLHAFCRIFPEKKGQMVVAYIHHGLRKNADVEKEFVQQVSNTLDLSFFSCSVTITKTSGESLENLARSARYHALSRLALEQGCSVVATGHTCDDQAETVLMNLFRGTGLKGLRGMLPLSPVPGSKKILLVRPLLEIMKKDIVEWLIEEKIVFMIDESNEEPIFRRNIIRNEIVPRIIELYPAFQRKIAETAQLLQGDYEVLESLARNSLSVKKGEYAVRREDFSSFSDALKKMVVRVAVQEVSGSLYMPSRRSVDSAIRAAKKRSGIQSFIPHNVEMRIGREYLIFARMMPIGFHKKIEPVVVESTGIFSVGDRFLTVTRVCFEDRFLSNPDLFTAYVNGDRLEFPFSLERAEKGMRFVPLGMEREVCIEKFWKTHRPRDGRQEKLPMVLTKGEEIVWVPGSLISQKYRLVAGCGVVAFSLKDAESGSGNMTQERVSSNGRDS